VSKVDVELSFDERVYYIKAKGETVALTPYKARRLLADPRFIALAKRCPETGLMMKHLKVWLGV
jgi:hypothetical protein